MPLLFAQSVKQTKAELLAALEGSNVPAGPINSLAEVFDDPQIRARGVRVELPANDAAAGTVPGVRSPIVLSDTPVVHDHAAPRFAEHTREVLRAIGCNDGEIDRLAAQGVIDVR
jgi:crotonobetainyl-CoA:carnitine CoA-transferase CaiB-like acyl-CoA transferase